MKAPRRTRYQFWLVLGVLSTVIPEVIAGSDQYPFFKITDYLIVIPLYTLHSLVLCFMIWNWGKPRLYNLFPAGAVFGLYEAYMTKVIWNPTWAAIPIKIGGIAVVETMILVLFWHSFLAFIVPLLVAESLTSTSEARDGMPKWLTSRMDWFRGGKRYLTLPLLAGLFQGINTPLPRDALLSGLTSTVICLIIIQLWRRSGGLSYEMRELLPTRRDFNTLITILLGFYALMGVFWRPEALPGLGAQATVWVLYILFGGLLYLGIRKSRNDLSSNPWSVEFGDKSLLVFGLVFTLGSVIGKITGLSVIAVYFVWIGGILFGLIILADTVRQLFEF